MRSGLPFDPRLPTLGLLLDVEAMAPLLARSLGRAAELGRVRVARVVYKPGDRVAVHYEALVDGRQEDAVARAVAGSDLAAKPKAPRYRQLARRMDGRSPAATPVRYEPRARALISWLPFDLDLPALAEPPHALARRLRRAGVNVCGGGSEGLRLSYKPGRRVVLRRDGHVLKAYGAAAQYERAARALRTASALTPLATPRFEASLPSLRLTAQQAVAGARPASSEEAAAEAGALVRSLQRSAIRSLEPAPPERQLESAARKAELIVAVLPALERRLDLLLRRLSAAIPVAPELVPAHGDFSADQLLRVGTELLAVDVDTICLGPAALDLAEYAAAADGDWAGLDFLERVLEPLLEGYGGRPKSLRWQLSAAILGRVSRPFQRLVPAWPERVEALVAAAEEALAR